MRMTADLSVVILAWNERENLQILLPALRDVLDHLGVVAEVVVADGGSTDGTREAAEQQGARVVLQSERGYGGALIAGFAATTAPYIITMDADLSHRPVFIEELWKRRHDAEMFIASRYAAGGSAEMGPLRGVLSQVLNRTYARVLSLPLRDLSSGFRMYRRDVLAGITVVARDFDALEELLIRVHSQGWRIVEVPFRYMARHTGSSHARLFKFGWAFAKTLVRMWQLRNSVAAADYDYRAFDSVVWLQRYWQRTRHRIILDYVGKGGRIVDVGCGSSRIVIAMPRAVAIDILEGKLRWLRPHHGPLVRASGDRLPLPDGTVTTLVTSEVIEHVTNAPQHLAEAARVLKPGGIMVVGTPDYGRWLWWAIEWVYRKVLPGAYAHEHVTHFTRASLADALRALDLEILDCRYVGFCEMIFKARKPLT
jgi:glycosyltransferase involved in cell wall biosynthesis